MDHPADPKSTKPSAAGGSGAPSRTPSPARPLRSARFEDDEEDKNASKAQAAIAWVMLAAVLALGGGLYVMMQKSAAEEKVKKAEETRLAAERAHADSIQKIISDSLFKARADSVEAATPKVKPPVPVPGADMSAGGTEAPPPPPQHFGIDVGTFLSEDRAKSEAEKLKGSTGLPVETQSVNQDGVTSYRVVVGDFTSRGTADEKATELIVSRAAREAKVIKLKR